MKEVKVERLEPLEITEEDIRLRELFWPDAVWPVQRLTREELERLYKPPR